MRTGQRRTRTGRSSASRGVRALLLSASTPCADELTSSSFRRLRRSLNPRRTSRATASSLTDGRCRRRARSCSQTTPSLSGPSRKVIPIFHHTSLRPRDSRLARPSPQTSPFACPPEPAHRYRRLHHHRRRRSTPDPLPTRPQLSHRAFRSLSRSARPARRPCRPHPPPDRCRRRCSGSGSTPSERTSSLVLAALASLDLVGTVRVARWPARASSRPGSVSPLAPHDCARRSRLS
jgi:hypothetical protein